MMLELLAVVAIAAGLGLGALALLELRQRLRALTRAVRAMTTGDLATPIAIAGPAELAELGAALDQLRTQVALHLAARERDAMHLEQQVVALERARRELDPIEPMANMGLLAAGIAHEIANPMTAVVTSVGYARDALADPIPDHAAIDEALRDARAAADRVVHILNELRTFSRGAVAGAGFAVGDVLDRVVTLVAPQTRDRCRLVRVEALDLPPVTGDEHRLAQALTNLVVNAVQAFAADDPARNTITIATAHEDRDVIIEVADNGPGIPPEHLRRVFEPFFTTRAGACAGLGLTAAKSLIRAMGGTITVTSQPGRGAIFEIRLRVYDGTIPRRAPRPSELAARALA
jgi:C4-dicarboxylate-specific signal transduction histidine kinase